MNRFVMRNIQLCVVPLKVAMIVMWSTNKYYTMYDFNLYIVLVKHVGCINL